MQKQIAVSLPFHVDVKNKQKNPLDETYYSIPVQLDFAAILKAFICIFRIKCVHVVHENENWLSKT